MGYSAQTPNPPGGVIQRRPGSQEPNDVLVDREFIKAQASRDYRNRRRVAGAKLTIDGSPQGLITVMGIPCLGLNGGPAFRRSEAFSFQVATDDQA